MNLEPNAPPMQGPRYLRHHLDASKLLPPRHVCQQEARSQGRARTQAQGIQYRPWASQAKCPPCSCILPWDTPSRTCLPSFPSGDRCLDLCSSNHEHLIGHLLLHASPPARSAVSTSPILPNSLTATGTGVSGFPAVGYRYTPSPSCSPVIFPSRLGTC